MHNCSSWIHNEVIRLWYGSNLFTSPVFRSWFCKSFIRTKCTRKNPLSLQWRRLFVSFACSDQKNCSELMAIKNLNNTVDFGILISRAHTWTLETVLTPGNHCWTAHKPKYRNNLESTYSTCHQKPFLDYQILVPKICWVNALGSNIFVRNYW